MVNFAPKKCPTGQWDLYILGLFSYIPTWTIQKINYHLQLEVERTSKNQISNIPIFRGSNFQHIQTSHLGQKPNFEPHVHYHEPNCLQNSLIKIGPNFSKFFKTELWTCLNIWFWPKTKLRTYQTSQKTKQFTNIKLFVPPLPMTVHKSQKLATFFLNSSQYLWLNHKSREFLWLVNCRP